MSRAHPADPLAATRAGQASALLTADDLAQRWSVPRAHVYRLAREGRLPTVRLGRYMRWRPEAVDAFELDGGAAND
jgi:excisionase family DNA binding protein